MLSSVHRELNFRTTAPFSSQYC